MRCLLCGASSSGHLRRFCCLLSTISSWFCQSWACWGAKKIAYFGGFFIALKTFYIFFMFLAFHMAHQGWLSHYIKVDAFLAGKTECFVWILVVFPQPWLIPIFFQPFFIKMAPARHCDVQLDPQTKYKNARKRELEHVCKPDMCSALVAQRTCARVTREHWERKQAVLDILSAFQGCYTLFTWTFVFTGFNLL